MRKRMLALMMTLTLVCTILVQLPIRAAAGKTDGRVQAVSTATTAKHNVIFMIDKSGSMNVTDKNRFALSAACQFIDQISTVSNELLDLSAVVNVGVMTFSQKTETVVPMVSLNTEANRNYLKSEINKIQFDPVNTGGTDLSTAVNDAMNALKQQSAEGVKNMVVMFTDGYSENVLDEKTSASNLENAFGLAEELGCQLYIVGLNHEGRIKEEGQQEIFSLANTVQVGEGLSTKAKNDRTAKGELVNYLITENNNDVREFYCKIYANMGSNEIIYVENHEFIVDSSGILEVDVTVYSDSKIKEVAITDPDGSRIIADSRNCFEMGDDFYKVIKILNPKTGKWRVDVFSDDDDYKTYVVKFYGVEAAINAVWDVGSKMAESGLQVPFVGKVTLIPMYKNERYEEESFIQSVTKAEFEARLEGTEETKVYPLTYQDGGYVGYFPVEQGVYEIEAVLATDLMNRQVSCTLAVTDADGAVNLELVPVHVKNTESVTISLPDRTGTEALRVSSLEILPTKKEAVTEVKADEKGNLTFQAKKIGSDRFKVTAMDDYGLIYNITGTVQVDFKLLWYHILLIAAAAAAVLAAVVTAICKLQRIPGVFKIRAELLQTQSGASKSNDVTSPRGRSVSLWALVQFVKQDIDGHPGDRTEAEEEISKALGDERNRIRKVLLVMRKNRRNQQVYFVRTERGSREVTDQIECYRSEKLSIYVSFEPLFQKEEMENDDFGRATDFKRRKRKTRSRQASSTFDTDYDE